MSAWALTMESMATVATVEAVESFIVEYKERES